MRNLDSLSYMLQGKVEFPPSDVNYQSRLRLGL